MRKKHLIRIMPLAAVFCAMVSFQSCTKIGQLLHFDLSMQTQSVTVDIPPASGVISVGPVVTSYNVDSFIKASTAGQLGVANIKSVKMSSCVMTINNPTPQNNFANFESASATAFSNTDTNPYTISITNNPNTYASTLNLPVDQTELSPYLGSQFTYSFTGKLRRATTAKMNVTITFTYSVSVGG